MNDLRVSNIMAIRTVFKYTRTHRLQLAPFHQFPNTMDKIKEIEGDLFDAPDGAALIRELQANTTTDSN